MESNTQSKVTLLHASPLWVAVLAIRKCWASEDKSDSLFQDLKGGRPVALDDRSRCGAKEHFVLGDGDSALIRKVVQSGHESTVEHLSYNFEIEGISRGLLQELARHRIASLSVQSTRYALKRLIGRQMDLREMIVSSGDARIDDLAVRQLEKLRKFILAGGNLPNDRMKYALPEAFKTTLIWTCNARSLRNFFRLRTSSRAHFEIRQLGQAIYASLPQDHRFIFADTIQ